MLAILGIILLALSPDYFRARLHEWGWILVVLGLLAIAVGVRLVIR